IMCSMKWVIPSFSRGSSRAPLRTHTPTATERRSGMVSVRSVIPDGSTVFRNAAPVMPPPATGAAPETARGTSPCPPAPRRWVPPSVPPAVSITIPAAVVVSIAAATVPAAVVVPAAGRGHHAALRLRQQRLARQLDLALAIHADDLHHHHVAHVQHVLGARHAMMIDLRDVEQAVPPRHDLDERAEGHDAAHPALIYVADLRVLGDVLDQLERALPALAVDRRDTHLARVLDVDLGPGLVGDAFDDLAPRSDDFADLVGRDVDDHDARRVGRHLRTRRGE